MPTAQEREIMAAKIKGLTNDLAGLELDGLERGNHKWASIKPQKHQVNRQHQYLDVLARLITSAKEPCLAVFYDAHVLLVASNYEEPRYAKHYLKCLGEFIETPNRENYEKLILLTTGQTKSLMKNESIEEELEQTKKKKKKETKKPYLEEFKSYICEEQELKADKIQKLAEQVLTELLNPENPAYSASERNDDWEKYLLPLEDTNIITNAIIAKRLDSKIISAIKEKNIDYIAGKKDVHAEMKIIGRLHETGRLQKTGGYIGITKLCCAPCQITLNMINKGRSSYFSTYTCQLFTNFLSQVGLISFQTRGTHGGTYRNWSVPDIPYSYQQKLLKKLKNLGLERKIREIASEIPSGLSSSVLFDQSSLSSKVLPAVGSTTALVTQLDEETEVGISDIFLTDEQETGGSAQIQVEPK